MCVNSWWTQCGKYSPKYSPRGYVLNSSISQWKMMYFLTGIVTLYVWMLGGLGVESTPLEDMFSTLQYHNGK